MVARGVVVAVIVNRCSTGSAVSGIMLLDCVIVVAPRPASRASPLGVPWYGTAARTSVLLGDSPAGVAGRNVTVCYVGSPAIARRHGAVTHADVRDAQCGAGTRSVTKATRVDHAIVPRAAQLVRRTP